MSGAKKCGREEVRRRREVDGQTSGGEEDWRRRGVERRGVKEERSGGEKE